MWQAWTNGILGAWLFISVFLGFALSGNMWNNLIVGIIAAIVALTMLKNKPWQGWLMLVVSIWLIISAFIPNLLTTTGNAWDGIIVGILLMIGGFGALGKSSSAPHIEASTN